MQEDQIRFTDGALAEIIDGYTMEAGVRSLERTIGTVCRKAAVRIAKGEEEKIVVNKNNLEKFLGAKRFLHEDEMREEDEVGAATGLAWTSVGGMPLTIEVSAMQGKGDILLTGKLGRNRRAPPSAISAPMRKSTAFRTRRSSTRIFTSTFPRAPRPRTDLPRALRWQRRSCPRSRGSPCGATSP